MAGTLQPDLCIVGGGASGLALAAAASSRGLSVVLVESGEIGGDRLAQWVPSLALLAASRSNEPKVDFAQARAQIAAAVARIAPNYSVARLEAWNVRLIRARGRFTRPDTLDAAGTTIKAGHFAVATGAGAKILPVQGLDLVRPLSCAELCRLEEAPSRLIVIGGDPQGIALAQAMRRLGAEAVILAPEKLLAPLDEELVAPVRDQLARDGVRVLENIKIHRLEPLADGLCVVFVRAPNGDAPPAKVERETIEGSHLLIAGGRIPVVEGVGLGAARVRYDAAGIWVDAELRTRNRRISAIGAVAKGPRSAGAADSHAQIVLRYLLHPGFRLPLEGAPFPTVARTIMTDPEIAVTGLSEAEARERRRAIRVLRWPFCETDRARVDGAARGHVKLITAASGKILGAGIVGPAAGELINLCTLAISKGMSATDLASIMVPYASLADAVRQAAAAQDGNERPGLARGLLRLLGR
ncbi:FAD-dependent oxidoreductase [Methylocapsa acidiphila]|uniref:FAD-dependent oxidoreductase n=1 Tax=Methylocapsa acidiphila TaxID=133552 RepID=UPI000420E452|nr:FAD-dependent oxidoreductase [Methylocapsa acidiphila]